MLVHVASAGDPSIAALAARGPVVVVEPLYGCTAVLAALDAGWDLVEIAAELPGAAPVPLVSWEQPPPAGAEACRVRCDDLAVPIEMLVDRGIRPVLACPSAARPAMSRVALDIASARGENPVVTFVPAPALHAAGDADEPGLESTDARDSWWACGMLVRVLLEELDEQGRDARLTDAAGIAVSVAAPDEDAASALASGARLRRHLARGGSLDDVRVASAIDSHAAVARVARAGAAGDPSTGPLRASWWLPAPPPA